MDMLLRSALYRNTRYLCTLDTTVGQRNQIPLSFRRLVCISTAKQQMDVKDKICFVAGGCGTVGSGIVFSLLQEGATVVVNSRSSSRLDELQKKVPSDLQRRLATIQEDCSKEDAIVRIKDFIIKEYGHVDHVVSSLGSYWQKGPLTDQSLEEFQAEIHNGAGTHFLVSKVFLPYLSQRDGSTYTFITGSGGERCFDPNISLLTVKAAALFGVAEAARAQYRGTKVTVVEIRIAVFVQPIDDSTVSSESTRVGTDFMGRFCTAMIQRRPPLSPFVRAKTRDQMNEMLKM